jgi:RNA polymerase II subunit A small phosphatase-like protein
MPEQNKPLLIFDLDETLMHGRDTDFREAEHTTEYGFVAVRNGVDDMLDTLADHYDFLIWSNNGRPYIDAMLKLVWPERHPLVDIFTSAEATVIGMDGIGIPFYKETRKVAKRHPQYSIDRILAVDDRPAVYRRNYGNLVAIAPFTGGYDEHLLHLAEFLIKIASKENLRKIEKRYWRSQPPTSTPDIGL